MFEIKKGIPLPTTTHTGAAVKPRKKTAKIVSQKGKYPSRSIMGFKITSKFDLSKKRHETRPFSWEALFNALRIGESFRIPKEKITAMRSASTKYSKRLKKKFVVIQLTKGTDVVGAQVGRTN